MSQNTSAPEKKLTAKDFINTGIFSVIFLVIFFLSIGIMSMAVVTQPFGLTVCAFIAGPVYMLMRAKSPKAGSILLFSGLFALVMFATGTGWPMPAAILLGALAAELLAFWGNYKSFLLNSIGYGVLMVASAAGSYTPLLMMKQYYLEIAASNEVNGDFMVQLTNFISGPVLFAAFGATAAGAFLGVLLARAMFKKHFIKAGLIKEVV